MLRSFSWRVTKPLRQAKSWSQALSRLVRRRAILSPEEISEENTTNRKGLAPMPLPRFKSLTHNCFQLQQLVRSETKRLVRSGLRRASLKIPPIQKHYDYMKYLVGRVKELESVVSRIQFEKDELRITYAHKINELEIQRNNLLEQQKILSQGGAGGGRSFGNDKGNF